MLAQALYDGQRWTADHLLLFCLPPLVIDSPMEKGLGVLYVVSTPIGNLEDVTLRALRVLKEVDFIACEDTRHSRKLLSHYSISKPMVSYYAPKEAQKAGFILERLKRGERVALITDAGTPLLSDPGWRLVKKAVEAGVPVVPVPGPSSILAALVASGLSICPFAFWGFPPKKEGELKTFLKEVVAYPGVHVFFESPRRVLTTLEVMAQVWGDREAVVAREVTKVHEEFIRGTLSSLKEELAARGEVRGEMVLMVAGGEGREEPWEEKVKRLLEEGFSLRDVAKILKVLYGTSRRDVYSRMRGALEGS